MNPTALVVPLALAAVTTLGTVATLHARPRAPVPAVAPAVVSEPRPLGGSVTRAPVQARGAEESARDGAVRPVPAPAPSSGVRPRGRWGWPLAPRPRVARPFVPPPTPYAAGHRGVDLAASPGQAVRAVDAGVVTHVGRVAGRSTVTVTHSSGVRSTYEPVSPVVERGDGVARGAVIGTVAVESSSHCAPETCLHLGALREQVYLDPLRLLGGGRVRLLPLGQAPDG